MPQKHPSLPYFDALLNQLQQGDKLLEQTFGHHVHWGYWEQPDDRQPNAEEFAAAAERLTALVYHAAQTADGQAILDVGCGFGGTVASLNQRHQHVSVTGLNIDPRQLARAQQQVTAKAGNTISWINADACGLPLQHAAFDSLLAVECIFHFPDRRRFFQEAFRVLKPGGRLALSDFISTPGIKPVSYIASLWPVSAGFYGRCDVGFTFARYRQLAEETGFVVRVETDITRNTLPTYAYLRGLKSELARQSYSAVAETLFAEWTSRLGLLRYGVLAFEKPFA